MSCPAVPLVGCTMMRSHPPDGTVKSSVETETTSQKECKRSFISRLRAFIAANTTETLFTLLLHQLR
jgi:hypothetical protein